MPAIVLLLLLHKNDLALGEILDKVHRASGFEDSGKVYYLTQGKPNTDFVFRTTKRSGVVDAVYEYVGSKHGLAGLQRLSLKLNWKVDEARNGKKLRVWTSQGSIPIRDKSFRELAGLLDHYSGESTGLILPLLIGGEYEAKMLELPPTTSFRGNKIRGESYFVFTALKRPVNYQIWLTLGTEEGSASSLGRGTSSGAALSARIQKIYSWLDDYENGILTKWDKFEIKALDD